jgi:hypothetical protein
VTASDTTMIRIGEALGLDRDESRARLEALWAETGPDGDPLHLCAIAHALADLQDDPAAELRWDQQALEAGVKITDARVRAAGIDGTARGMLPSLHLNLGDVYSRTGDLDSARRHLDLGRADVDALPDGGYGRMITEGLDRLATRLGVPSDGVTPGSSSG